MGRLLEIAFGNACSAALFAVVVAFATRFVRRPALVHAMWVLVLLRLFAPPFFELPLLAAPSQGTAAFSTTLPVQAPIAEAVELPAAFTRGDFSLRHLAVAIWSIGAFLILSLAVLRVVRFRRLLRTAHDPDADLEAQVCSVARSMGVDHPPAVKVIEEGAPPMLWGFLTAPSLILPVPLLAELEDDELDALIAHELAHLARRDHWVRHLELMSSLAFWWHPVTWWARRKLRFAEELCCDLEVTRRLPDLARAYARCLVKTVRFLSLRPPPMAVGSAMASFHDLKGRITMIMTNRSQQRLPVAQRVVLAVLAVGLLALSPTLAARSGGDEPKSFSGDPISLELSDANLRDLLSSLSKITDLTFVLHPAAEENGLLEQPVSTSFTDTPWDEVLDTILDICGLGWTREGSVVWIHPKWQAPAGVDDGAGNRQFMGNPITLSFEAADVRDVMETFGQLTGMKIWVAADVEGTVTADLDDIPWDQALDLIIQMTGLQYRRDDAGIFVERRSEATGEVLSPGRTNRPVKPRDADGAPFRFVVGGSISEPMKIDGPAPVYPEEAREAGVGGVVVMETVIEADGSVGSVKVLRGEPHGLTEAAVEAVRQWRFEPGVYEDRPVAVSYILTVRFNLDFGDE